MLLLHEVHKVAGAQEEAFDAAYRDEFLPALGKTDDARLLWYLRLAHGSGAAYTVVSITGCRDAAAWSTLADRVRTGDLQEWSTRVDAMRHECVSKIITPVSWSPRQDIDLTTVPATAEEHELALFMEDTAWPYAGGLQAYIQKAGTQYAPSLDESKERHQAWTRISIPTSVTEIRILCLILVNRVWSQRVNLNRPARASAIGSGSNPRSGG